MGHTSHKIEKKNVTHATIYSTENERIIKQKAPPPTQ